MINPTDFTYNDTFNNTISSTYSIKGTQWLASLPTIIEQCALQWNLSALKPYPVLTYNYVMSGTMHDKPIVLKLRCDQTELQQEIAAVEALNGYGCVRVLAYDLNLGAMILERAVPGEPLTTLFPHDDTKATRIAANCIQSLHKAPFPESSLFQTLEQTLPHFTKTATALDPFIIRAQELKKQLLATQQENVLLHGDFHGGNILSSDHNQWVVIDPEGIIGDPVYDLAVYIRNPLTELIACPDALTIISNRMHDFATLLGYTPQQMYDWTYLQTVSSAYWSIEDKLDITRHIAFLTLLKKLVNKI